MFSKPIFFLLSGKRKSGKDFIADQLMAHVKMKGYSTKKISISSLLYDEVLALHPGLTREMLDDNKVREKYRGDMISIGNHHRKVDGEDFLIKDVERRGIESGVDVVFVPNIRSDNEFTYFQREGRPFKTLRITVPDFIRAKRGWEFNEEVDRGNLEMGLDHVPVSEWDYWVVHDGCSWHWYQKRLDTPDDGMSGIPFHIHGNIADEIGRLVRHASR